MKIKKLPICKFICSLALKIFSETNCFDTVLVKVGIFEAFQEVENVLLVFKDHYGPDGPHGGSEGSEFSKGE